MGSVEMAGEMQRCSLRLPTWRVSVLDVPFADDMIFFLPKSYEEIGQALDMLVDALPQLRLVPNAGKSFKDAEPTTSRTCIAMREGCGNFGTRPCPHVVRVMVNGQWSTLYAPLGSLFQAQGGEL